MGPCVRRNDSGWIFMRFL